MSDDKVNKALDTFAAQEQFPVRSAGKASQDAFVGHHKVFFQGSTGLVATQFGFPGVTVGRLSTGVYGIRYPRWREVGVDVSVQSPSGFSYLGNTRGMSGVGEIVGVSGGAEFVLNRNNTISNPATGTVAYLRFFVRPVTAY